MAKKTSARGTRRRRRVGAGGSAGQTSGAISRGRTQAAAVLAFRKTQLKKRAKAVTAIAAHGIMAMRAPSIPLRTLRTLGPLATAGLLMAEGDSWFDYPKHDVLRLLEDNHGFEVESLAHHGDDVEQMAYSDGQLEEFTRRLEKILRDQQEPRAILLSGGGNDIAGEEFSLLLNHACSSIPGLNDDIVRGVIDQRIREAYTTIIAAITAVCEEYLGRPIPILIHGYDYSVPDGRGYRLGPWTVFGPWLKPGFGQKGFTDGAENTKLMKKLMDRFNEMIRGVAAEPEFSHVRFVDLRRTLPIGVGYRDYWDNELHPTERGFAMVAKKFATVIESL